MEKLIKNLKLDKALNWITLAWNSLQNTLITNYFIHSGFNADIIDENDNTEDTEISNLSEMLANLQNNSNENIMTSTEFITFEEEIEVISHDWKQDILEEADNYNDLN